jgi:large subunit ribosomal protein L32
MIHVSAVGAPNPNRGRIPLLGYTRRSLMAVPKKKTSKARRDKRRAQHSISPPRLNLCPQCGRPKRPHRMCPTCHTYRDREIEPIPTPAP